MKGFGQSSKDQGDFTWEGVSEQFRALLDVLGLEKINLITHDRGTVLGDYFAGNHPDRVIRYARGEQHLYHYHPMLSPQHALFGQVSELADPRVRLAAGTVKMLASAMAAVRLSSTTGVGIHASST